MTSKTYGKRTVIASDLRHGLWCTQITGTESSYRKRTVMKAGYEKRSVTGTSYGNVSHGNLTVMGKAYGSMTVMSICYVNMTYGYWLWEQGRNEYL